MARAIEFILASAKKPDRVPVRVAVPVLVPAPGSVPSVPEPVPATVVMFIPRVLFPCSAIRGESISYESRRGC
jgi:hypothetical protein